jgi:hypothetical protein
MSLHATVREKEANDEPVDRRHPDGDRHSRCRGQRHLFAHIPVGMARGFERTLPLVALFGGLPFLSGIVFIAGGTAMLRRERRRDHRDSAKYFE